MTRPKNSRGTWRAVRRKWLRPVRNAIVGAVGPLIIRAWIGTLRVRWSGDMFMTSHGPNTATRGIFAFWHQGLLSLAGCFRNSRARVVISGHGDGEMIARIISRLGMQPVRGSSTRGGTQALLELLRNDDDVNIGVTPDGPRGPKHHFQSGAVYLASRAGLPVYPLTACYERYASLPTWDGFMLPRPFSRVLIRFGEAVDIPRGLKRVAIEAARAGLEATLRELTSSTQENFAELFAEARKARDLGPRPLPQPRPSEGNE